MKVFETLQNRYQDLVAESLGGATDESFLESVHTLLRDIRQAGAVVAHPERRALLRAYMRFLVTLLREAGQEVSGIDLLPLDRERWTVHPPAGQAGPRVPTWVWGLTGAAALVVLAGLVAVAGLSLGAVPLHPTSTPPPVTPTPPPPSPTLTPTPSPTSTPTPTPRPTTPVFSDLTIALGMLSPTEPFLVGNEFDWNTKAIYAVFDYAGMRDGLTWSVVWTRNGEETARENHLWDVERDGSSGTRWAAYFNPEGTVLRGGDYTVSIYIEDRLQTEASFHIRYYVPPAP